MPQNHTTEQLAEEAADVVLRAHGIHNVEGTIENLGVVLGGTIPVEQGLRDLVKAAVVLHGQQEDPDPLSVLVDVAQKRSTLLTEYIAAEAEADDTDRNSSRITYQVEKDRINTAIFRLTEGK